MLNIKDCKDLTNVSFSVGSEIRLGIVELKVGNTGVVATLYSDSIGLYGNGYGYERKLNLNLGKDGNFNGPDGLTLVMVPGDPCPNPQLGTYITFKFGDVTVNDAVVVFFGYKQRILNDVVGNRVYDANEYRYSKFIDLSEASDIRLAYTPKVVGNGIEVGTVRYDKGGVACSEFSGTVAQLDQAVTRCTKRLHDLYMLKLTQARLFHD